MADVDRLLAFIMRGRAAQAAVDDRINEMGAAPRNAAPTRNSDPPVPAGGSVLAAHSDLARGTNSTGTED